MAMASTILRFPTLTVNLKPQNHTNPQLLRHGTSKLSTGGPLPCKRKHGAQSILQIGASKGENPRSKWKEVGPNITKLQKQAISQLPLVMTNRSKAVMKQLICFSGENWSLVELLTTWVDIMKPRRADWLSVLKQLLETDHPFYIQVAEFALPEESFEANNRDYTKLIHYYGKQHHLEDAERIFSSMKERGVVHDQVTLTAMVHMYSKAGYHKKAEETFYELTLLGKPLDKRSYGSMVKRKGLRGLLMQCRLQVLFLMTEYREGEEAEPGIGVSRGVGERWSYDWERSFSYISWMVWKVGRCERNRESIE
ncbi:Pentatricopeptide repeat-containing protein At1g01970 [Linum perenne]